MSRIGKLPITIPAAVEVSQSAGILTVKGPKGELNQIINPKILVVTAGDQITVSQVSNDVESAEFHGLTRTLIDNMTKGVSEGFKKELEINGIGYRASISGNKLTLSLGYSHPIEYIVPEDIQIAVEKNIVIVSGADKQKVGQVSAEIRAFRKPEPYKGKGVKYVTEHIRRKAGKTGAK
jgi:large subunit ribosomal protein L6